MCDAPFPLRTDAATMQGTQQTIRAATRDEIAAVLSALPMPAQMNDVIVCVMQDVLARCGDDYELASELLGISQQMLEQELRFDGHAHGA